MSVEDPEGEPLADFEVPESATPKGYRRQLDKSKRAKDEASEFWKRCLADPIGRREIWAFLQTAGTFERRFACGPNGFPQAEATWFNAGQHDLGQNFYQMLARVDRAKVFLMHDEYDSGFAKPRPTKRTQSEG